MKNWIFALFLCAQPCLADEIWLGATTTLEDSGILERLISEYESKSDDEVVLLAQPSGQILQSARDGLVDLTLTHDPEFEAHFADQGFARAQAEIMRSRFVLVGPGSDPAQVRGMDIDAAFRNIHAQSAQFVSREDQSGTSERENKIWQRNQIDDLDFRLETGQGMGATLNIASATNAYVFSEIATFLAFQNKRELQILCDQGEDLDNIYTLSLLNPEKFPKRNLAAADRLASYLNSKEAQKIIAEYGISGQFPFTPYGEKNNYTLDLR